jgi:hypothetical protein
MMTAQKNDPGGILQPILKNKYCPYLILSAIFIFQIILGIYYILADTRVLAWDQSLHLTLALQYSKLLEAGKVMEMIGLSGYYPPLYHLSTIPLYVFGISEDSSIFVNFLYLAILLVSVYGIGRILFDKKTGLLAAFIISCYPFIIAYERDYMLELALVSLISLSLFFLLKSDNFQNRTYSVLFGIALACSLLIKWSAIIFLIVPMAYLLINNSRKCAYCGKPSIEVRQGMRGFCSQKHADKYNKSDSGERVHPALNFSIAIVVAFVIAGIWYLPNINEVIGNLLFFSGAQTSQPGMLEKDQSVLSFQSLSYYSSAVYSQIYLFFTILLVIGIIFLLLDKTIRDKAAFFMLSILFPYLFFTLVRNKDTRYTAPLLVFFAVVSAFWVFRIDTRVQRIVVAIIAIVCVVQVSALTFGVPGFNTSLLPSQAPNDENWMVPDAIYAIRDSLPTSANHRITVVVLPDYPYVNGRTYEYYAELNNAPFVVYNGAYIPLQSFEKFLPSFDYIIYKEGGALSSGPYDETVIELYRLFEIKKDNFEAIREIPLPDNSTLIIFKNHNL